MNIDLYDEMDLLFQKFTSKQGEESKKEKDFHEDQTMTSGQCLLYSDSKAPAVVLRSLFEKYDTDKNGKLDRIELNKLLSDDLGMDEEQSEAYRHLLDKDADGLVSYSEFEIWMNTGERFQTIDDKTRYHYLKKAVDMFKQFDEDKNGAIDKKEFHKLFKGIGGKGKKKEKQALAELDVDKNGRLSFQEFMHWLNWVPLEDLVT